MKTSARTTLHISFFLALIAIRASAQAPASTVYLDPSQPVDVRVDDLIKQMTL